MNSPFDELIHVQMSVENETRNSPRYAYENDRRGNERYVILQYTEKGEGSFEFQGRVHPVPEGHAFIALVPEKSIYRYPKNARRPWTFSWINFTGDLGLRLWRGLRDHAGPVLPLPPSAVQLMRQIRRRISSRQWIDAYEMSGRAYAFYLETVRHLPARRAERRFEGVARYFQDNYQKTIRIKEVSAQLGLSREHFTRAFAGEMNETPAAWLRRIRLEAAALLLRTSQLAPSEIAFRTGWSAPAKLDFFFRRHYGATPRDYRAHAASARRAPAAGARKARTQRARTD